MLANRYFGKEGTPTRLGGRSTGNQRAGAPINAPEYALRLAGPVPIIRYNVLNDCLDRA